MYYICSSRNYLTLSGIYLLDNSSSIMQKRFSPLMLRYDGRFSGIPFLVNLQLCPYWNHCRINTGDSLKNGFTFSSCWNLLHFLSCCISNLFQICLHNTMWSSYLVKLHPAQFFCSYIIQVTCCVICNRISIFIFHKNHLPWWSLSSWNFRKSWALSTILVNNYHKVEEFVHRTLFIFLPFSKKFS